MDDIESMRTESPHPEITIEEGCCPTLLERVVQMHAVYYGANYDFGQVFESKVASEMAEFLSRADLPSNSVWYVLHNDEIAGSVSIDGEDLGGRVAHLRWFIADDAVRGTGAGRLLLAAAMEFVDQQAFEETHLWTFKGLDAARRLYELHGFALVEENSGQQWGIKVMEQKYVRPKGGNTIQS